MTLRLMLAGDLIGGRGIDQVLPFPGDPTVYESWRNVTDARFYIRLATRKNGPLPAKRGFEYIWGDLPPRLDELAPDLRIVNLETAITTETAPWPDKRMHFRMNPANAPALSAGRIDCCALANNHTMDWGRAGLEETMATLRGLGIRFAGAGVDRDAAEAPAVLETRGGTRVLLLSMTTPDTHTPETWAATDTTTGVNMVAPGMDAVARVAGILKRHRRPGDIAVASIHWGPNRVNKPDPGTREFAHALIDRAGVDLVHGHSAHHVREIEVYRDRLILYGCGDLLNDYEGLNLYPRERPEMGLVYFADLDPAGRLAGLTMIPIRIRKMRMNGARAPGAQWLMRTLNRRSRPFGVRVAHDGGLLHLRWPRETGTG